MDKLQYFDSIDTLRQEYEEVMIKVADIKYDLATRRFDNVERKTLEKIVQYQEWAADEMLKRAEYNAEKYRKEGLLNE